MSAPQSGGELPQEKGSPKVTSFPVMFLEFPSLHVFGAKDGAIAGAINSYVEGTRNCLRTDDSKPK